MSLIPIPNNSDLTTYFTVGQRKALDTLGNVILQALLTYIQNNPSELDISINDLSDVVAPSPASGDALVFDGVDWGSAQTLTQVISSSTTPYIAALTDSGKYIVLTSGSSMTFEVPPQASVAWGDGSQFEIEQGGAGQVTIQGGSGVTINVASAFSASTRTQNAVVGLKRISENTWTLFGDLEQA